MNITNIRCFWEVVKTRNFSEAAERLYFSQSTVSKNISALEKEIGFQLFERRGRIATLTSEGQKVLKSFGEIVAVYDRAEAKIDEIRKTVRAVPNNAFNISVVPLVERLGIISDTNSLKADNPDFELVMEVMEETQVNLALHAGHCDVAFCSDLKLDSALYHMHKYCSVKLKLVVSPDHPFANKEKASICDLEGQDLILLHPESNLWELSISACEAAGFYPRVVLATCRPEIALEYVTSGNCIYMTMDVEADEYKTKQYKVIELEDSPEFEFVFAWKRQNKISKLNMKYIDFLVNKWEEKLRE